MKAQDYRLKKYGKKEALFDLQMSHINFRILSGIEYLEEWEVDWNMKTWKELSDLMGINDRSTIAKGFKRLSELGYLEKI